MNHKNECNTASSYSNQVVILDGGFSSQLQQHSSTIIDGDPLWSARSLFDDPKSVIETHLDFLRAGSKVITTNTYQASVGGFVKHLNITKEKALQLIVVAVSCAREAINLYHAEKTSPESDTLKTEESEAGILVAGSVGPYGACLADGSEYNGSYVESVDEEELASWHRPRVKTLVEAGVDLLAFETIPALKEAKVLVRMLVEEFPDQKAWLSFSSQDGERTAHGEKFECAVQECWEMGRGQLVAIGANCLKPSHATSLLMRVRDGSSPPMPLIIYPNSGEKWDHEKGWLDKHLSESLRSFVPQWMDLGVCYIGGCCRVYAEDVSAIREEVEAHLQKVNTKA